MGIPAAFGQSRLIAGLLFGVEPWDAAVSACAPVILFAVALLAAWLPAERASKIGPDASAALGVKSCATKRPATDNMGNYSAAIGRRGGPLNSTFGSYLIQLGAHS